MSRLLHLLEEHSMTSGRLEWLCLLCLLHCMIPTKKIFVPFLFLLQLFGLHKFSVLQFLHIRSQLLDPCFRIVSEKKYDVNEWHFSFKSKESQRAYCTKLRLIDNKTLHRLCKIREATMREWMNGSCALNGWLTTPTPCSEVLANILRTASVKHHYANG